MKKGLLAVVLLTAVTTSLSSAPSDLALVAVNDPGPGTVESLLSANVLVVRDMERYLLVAAASDDLALFDELDLDWQLLDPAIGDKTYYTVGVRSDADVQAFGPEVRVLRFDGREAVIEASPGAAETLSEKHEIARVFFRAIHLAPVDKPIVPEMLIEPDPRIQQMVDQVSGPVIDGHVQRLEDFVTRYSTSDSCQAAANWIKNQFESFGIDSVYFHHWSSTYKDNVVAVIPGVRDPEKIVVIGGHYDSTTSNHAFCPGADDDASGTACVLEVARVLASYTHDYTITFVAFSAEEQGLLGSEAYASMARARGDDIIGMVQVDMIGYVQPGDALDLDIISNTSSGWLRDLVIDVGNAYVTGFSVVPGSLPGGASSDHASFWAAGYDAILFFEDSGDYSPYIHTANDVVGVSYNNPTLALNSVKTATALVATMAQAPPLVIEHTPLANTPDTQNPYRVAARVLATGALNPDSLLVRYSTGAGTFDLAMTPAGAPNEFEAFIPPQAGGTFVDYFIVAEDTDAHRLTHPADAPSEVHTFFVGTITPVVADDLETETGWTVGAPGDNATTGIWVRVDPNGTFSGSIPVQPEDDHTPAPGIMCFVTGNAPPGSSQGSNDVDNGKTTLLTPVYDLSGVPNAWVHYYRWYSNDTGSAAGTDPFAVDVSSDGGTSWFEVEYTFDSNHAWDLVVRNLGEIIDLSSQVQLRFVARDDAPGSIVEAAIDDFAIMTYEEPTTDVLAEGPAVTARVVLEQNRPNPFNPVTEIRFSVPAPGAKVTLRIFDVAGREVRALLEDELTAGTKAVTWDGRDGVGREMPSAVYFYQLDVGGKTFTRKLVLAK